MSLLSRAIMLGLLVAVFATAPASAAENHPQVALVVDVQRVLDQSEAAKGVQKQIDLQRGQFQADTEKEENQLRQAELELGKAHEHLAAEAYNEREQQLRQKFIAVERHVDMRRKLLDQGFTDAMNVVRDQLLALVQTIAHEKNANLVLVKQQILWADSTLDVTDEVLKRLNKTLPQVTLKPAHDDKAAK